MPRPSVPNIKCGRRSGVIDLLIFNIKVRWRWVIGSGFGLLYLQRKNPQYERTRRMSGLQSRSRCFGEEIKSPALVRKPTTISRLTNPWSISLLTTLSRLLFGRVKRRITKSFVMTPKASINFIKNIMSAAVPPAC